MKRIACALLASGLIISACGESSSDTSVKPSPPKGERGQVVSAEPLLSLSRQQATSLLGKLGFRTPAPRYGVDAYRVVYRTVDTENRPTTASGLVALPRGGERTLPTVAYTHGTQPTKAAAATTNDESYDRAGTVFMAAAGFGAVAPDYLGLGLGTGPHPYMHHASEVTASLDMLEAADEIAADHDRKLDRRVRVTGFSQGGPAAMGLGRELQKQGRLAALAPVSGPYDVEHAEFPAALTQRTLDPDAAVLYIGYWLTSMNRIYDLYRSPGEVFAKPYDATMEGLFDGERPPAKLEAGLPESTEQMLTPAAVKRMLHPTGEMARALRENDDTCRWRPTAPVRLFAAHGDRDVAIANSHSCARSLRANGVEAPVIDVGGTDHNGSELASLPRIVTWFATV